MNIASDIDDTFLEFSNPFIDYINKRLKTNYMKKDFTSFDYNDIMGISKQKFRKLINDFYMTEIFKNLKPMILAVDIYQELIDISNNSYFFSARPSNTFNATRNNLLTYLQHFKEDNIILTNEYSKCKEKITKKELCEINSIDVLWEDSPIHSVKCAELGVLVILMKNEYNKHIRHKNIIHCNSWIDGYSKMQEKIYKRSFF